MVGRKSVARKKSKSELLEENRILRSIRLSDGVISVLNNLVRWGGTVFDRAVRFLGDRFFVRRHYGS